MIKDSLFIWKNWGIKLGSKWDAKWDINRGINLFLALMALCPTNSKALQIKNIIQDERLAAKISFYDLNRIEVRGDRISSVFGNSGAFTVDQDTQKGHLYIKPTGSRQPLSITITTENGLTQDLILIPFDIPGETLILKGVSSRDLIQFIQQMATLSEKEKFLNHKRIKYDLQGEILTFKNDTSRPLSLQEKQFATKGTLAVGLEKQVVQPQETIFIYRVREKNDFPNHSSLLEVNNKINNGINNLSDKGFSKESPLDGGSEYESSDDDQTFEYPSQHNGSRTQELNNNSGRSSGDSSEVVGTFATSESSPDRFTVSAGPDERKNPQEHTSKEEVPEEARTLYSRGFPIMEGGLNA